MDKKALTPSYLSATIDILIAIVFTVGAYIASLRPQSSSLNQALYYFHNQVNSSYNQLASKLTQNRFIDDLPLILFWLLVGVAVYFVTIEIVRSVKHTVQLADDINNSNVNRRESILKDTAFRTAIRILTITIWYVYLQLFILRFIPLDLSYIHKFSMDRSLSNSIILALLTIALLLLLHVNTVVFRFIALKKRLISKYED